MAKKAKEEKVVKIPAESKEVKAAKKTKTAVVKTKGGYKDTYGNKVWESKEQFLSMKLSHEKSIFTILHNLLADSVKKGVKNKTIDVPSVLNVPKIDHRFPSYILGFIPNGNEYSVTEKILGEKKSWLTKFNLTQKLK